MLADVDLGGLAETAGWPRTPDELDSHASLGRAAASGMEPSEVAGMVVEAIKEERLLLLTDPKYADRLRSQTESLLTGDLPDHQ
ncbi:hypothetical protein ABGB18_39615 [Nonomuraea sp. B12E4]|uniref:hypothetical protein n=1 Tax=Nonomuraea sp. B12E4 TaxID=3153564 RepID=UPI00325E88AC